MGTFFFEPFCAAGIAQRDWRRDGMGATPLWIQSLDLPVPDVLVAVV